MRSRRGSWKPPSEAHAAILADIRSRQWRPGMTLDEWSALNPVYKPGTWRYQKVERIIAARERAERQPWLERPAYGTSSASGWRTRIGTNRTVVYLYVGLFLFTAALALIIFAVEPHAGT